MLNFKATRIMVVAIWAEDVPAAVHFYRDVLGLALRADHAAYPAFKVGDGNLIILRGLPRPAEEPEPDRFPIFALAVDDLEAAVEWLSAHGVSFPWGIEGQGDNRWVMFPDPAGNLIELAQEVGHA
jgi:catechol 2,3-dioxygenase-like lactoylglutathione lyase family enzyme